MKKFEKILLIILIVLIVCLGVGLIVLYIIVPDLTITYINNFIDLINKPLPIIGVTTAAVLIFIWKMVISMRFGKAKLAEYEAKAAKMREEYELFKVQMEQEKQKIEELNNVLREQLVKACQLSTNKKIKDFGKELNHEETINSETKAE